MAIAIATSPPLVSTASATSLPTAAFDAPAQSLLVACTMIGGLAALSNSGAALTWTQRHITADNKDAIWTAPVPDARTGMTVTVARDTAATFVGGFSVYVLTGAGLSNPIGATGNGTSTTNNITPTGYNSTIANSRGFAVARDTAAGGTPTSTDDEQAWVRGINTAGMSVVKAANTATPGTGVTFNFDAFGTSAANWTWIAVEITEEQPIPPTRVWTPPTAVHRAANW
ncbi:hypothetical protein ACIBK9_47055 [Nonomuraea sp. NPDC050227]|uniref:hypothetical protein n=1 Tax=Nonomuraea sp. NPDC050227 TaxID=3364360 RepID=UPI0037938819